MKQIKYICTGIVIHDEQEGLHQDMCNFHMIPGVQYSVVWYK